MNQSPDPDKNDLEKGEQGEIGDTNPSPKKSPELPIVTQIPRETYRDYQVQPEGYHAQNRPQTVGGQTVYVQVNK